MSLLGNVFNYAFQEPAYNLLMLLYGIVHSFGLAIILVTLLIRAAMIPLYRRQLKSSLVMQQLGPQIQEIQRKYRSEPLVMQQHLSALYKENHYNPYASCLPLLVQMPFLYGLYGAFRLILNNQTSSTALTSDLYPFIKPIFGALGVAHISTNFFFIDLAKPDPTYILPIVAAIATFVQIRMSLARSKAQMANRPKTSGAPDPNAATMKMMQFLMPGITLIMGIRFQAGLALYWTISTLFTVGQQYFVNGRNWGGLLDGLPLIGKPVTTVPAIVDAASGPSPYRNRFSSKGDPGATTVTEERPATKARPALPPPGKNGAREMSDDTVANKAADAPAPESPKPATKPATNGASRPAPSKKDAVRLVTANNAGGSVTSPSAVVRAPVTRPTTAANRAVAGSKPKSNASKSTRKKR